jgi:energy-converting hydrogenase Eha subunit A
VQGICLPFRGFSRSGSTISTGLLLGLPKQKLEEFSFALAVVLTPPIIAQEAHRLIKEHALSDHESALHLFCPVWSEWFSAFAAGLLALEMALALARRRTLEIFRLLLPDRGGGRAADSLQSQIIREKSFRFRSGMKIFFPTIKLFGFNPGFAARICAVVTFTPFARYALAMAEIVSPLPQSASQ